MATFTSLGIGSGLDLNTMLSQLVALERKPIAQLQTEASKLQTKVSAVGQVKSLVSSLQDAANKLSSAGLWSASLAVSNNADVVSPVSGSTADEGSYSITVQSLAAAQTVSTTTAYADANALVGAGTLTIDIGTWDSGLTNFTAKPGGTPVTLAITATDTVTSLRDKINALGAGVTASIVSDATGTRIALRSSVTGEGSGFRVSVADSDGLHTDATGLSRIAFDPVSGTTGTTRSQAATNAVATVNGISVTSVGNELSGVVQGLTLRLRGLSATPVQVDVSADRDGVKKAVQAFADAYNALAKNISQQTAYDAATKVAGTLQGDSSIGGLLRRVRGVFNDTSAASSAFARLSNIGLELQRDGTISIDSAKLDTALNNRSELQKAFSNLNASDTSQNGFARRFSALATEVLGVDGVLTTRDAGLQKLLTKNRDDQARLEDRVTRFQERMTAQFTAMDSRLSKLTALNSYVTQQIAAMNKAGSS